MTTLRRATTVWTGLPGMPGYTTLYCDSSNATPSDFTDGIGEFLTEIKTDFISQDVTATVLDEVQTVDSTNGQITGVDSGGGNKVFTGALTQDSLPLSTQLLLQFRTGAFFGGRELRGRMFIPGLCEPSSTDGTVDPDTVSGIQGPADTLFSVLLAVYSPTKHQWASVNSVTVWDQWAVLRSRRD